MPLIGESETFDQGDAVAMLRGCAAVLLRAAADAQRTGRTTLAASHRARAAALHDLADVAEAQRAG